eukprot:scaffold6786_cov112-Isochrysis_galbana.AAC.7
MPPWPALPRFDALKSLCQTLRRKHVVWRVQLQVDGPAKVDQADAVRSPPGDRVVEGRRCVDGGRVGATDHQVVWLKVGVQHVDRVERLERYEQVERVEERECLWQL